jgi:peptidoglycan/LPS O-acetylase OafA/YrhL
MSTALRSARIPELDGLRGIAIGWVVLFHYTRWGPPTSNSAGGLFDQVCHWLEPFAHMGWTGVDLFFVLSGFLIGGILIDSRDSDNYYKAFYMRRFYRILPLYYLWILGYILLNWSAHRLLMVSLADPIENWRDTNVFWLFAFIQNFHFASRVSFGWFWLGPTWSLAVEEQFYLVAPLLIRRLSKNVLFIFMGAIFLAAPAARMWVRYHVPIDTISLDLSYTLMPCRADALAIGVIAALLWRTESFRSWLSSHVWVLYSLLSAFLGGMVVLGLWSPDNLSFPMESLGYTWIAIFYGLLLLLVLEKRSGYVAAATRWRGLAELGRISYCVYLLHLGVAWLFRETMLVLVKAPPLWGYAVCYSLAAVMVYYLACLSWRDIEYPLLRRGHAYSY